MDKQKALERLRREREYEEGLVERLNNYILNRLEKIKDLTEEEQKILYSQIKIITHDSIRHSYLFSDLMQMVLEEDERDKY